MDVLIALESTQGVDSAAHLATWLNAAGWSNVRWGDDHASLKLKAVNTAAVEELKLHLTVWLTDRPEAESVTVVVDNRTGAPSAPGVAVFGMHRDDLTDDVPSGRSWLAELDTSLSGEFRTLAEGYDDAASDFRNERDALPEPSADSHPGYFPPDSLAVKYHELLSPEAVPLETAGVFTALVRAARGLSSLPVTIYLSDEGAHANVEAAVEQLVAAAGLRITRRDDPVIGSWFRRMRAAVDDAARSRTGREVALTATHVADARLVLAQDAAITATFLQNLAPVISALQPTKDAVVRLGAVLLVKVDWAVSIHQLTAAQQALLDHDPRLALAPHEILTALSLTSAVEHSTSH